MTVLRFCDCYTNLDRECVDVCVVDKRFWFRSSPCPHVYGYFTKLTFSSVFWFLSFTIVATNTDGNGLFWLYSWWGRPEIINHPLLLDWFDLILFPFLSFYIIVLICEFRLFYLFLSYLDEIVWCIHCTRYCTVYNKLILSLSHMLFYAVFTVEKKGIFDSVTKTNASCISFCSLIYHCYFKYCTRPPVCESDSKPNFPQ